VCVTDVNQLTRYPLVCKVADLEVVGSIPGRSTCLRVGVKRPLSDAGTNRR
jgi:hypothetical protein